MKIENLTANTLENYIHLERYVNDGSPSGFTFANQVSERFQPQNPYRNFQLPIFLVPRDEAVVVGDYFDIVLDGYDKENFVPIPVHPDLLNSENKYFNQYPDILVDVVPTASSRTVLYKSGQKNSFQFIKLHYPKLLGRFDRSIPLYKWIAAKESTQLLRSLKQDLPQSIAFFDDVVSIYLDSERAESNPFGMMYRNFPDQFSFTDENKIIPMFSLFSQDKESPEDKSLLQQLVEAKIYDEEMFYNKLIRRLINAYYYLSNSLGLIPECNAQNIVLQFSKNWTLEYIAFRDMENIWKDLSLRKNKGLEYRLSTYHTLNKKIDSDYYKRRSFLYDFKLGEYVLHPLCSAFAETTNSRIEKIESKVRKIGSSIWTASANYFRPSHKYYFYPKSVDVSRDLYCSSENPKYR